MKPQVDNEYPPSGSMTAKTSIPGGFGLKNSRQKKPLKKSKKRIKRCNQTLIETNLNHHKSFLSKHNRNLSIKPVLCDNKENLSVNIEKKDLWYNINKVLERNGYTQISLSNETNCDMVCETVLNILNDYEKRGRRLQELLLNKRNQEDPTKVTSLRNEVAKRDEQNEKLKERIKSLEYDLNHSNKFKRKEWNKSKEDDASKLENKIKDWKQKCIIAQNTSKSKEKEINKLKVTIETMIHKSEKAEKRNSKTFEKIFGRQPKNADSKILEFIKGFETQRERLEQQVDLLWK